MEPERRLVELFRTLDVNFERLIELPQGEKEPEWIAYHMSLFFKHTTRLVAIISMFCTPDICPTMSIAENWDIILRVLDSEEKTIADLDNSDLSAPGSEDSQMLSAADYTNTVLEWCLERLSSQDLFPIDSEQNFPEDFKRSCRHMLRRLLHIYFHIYTSHFDIVLANCLQHYNTSFRYMIEFGLHYNLLRESDLLPMMSAIEHWRKTP